MPEETVRLILLCISIYVAIVVTFGTSLFVVHFVRKEFANIRILQYLKKAAVREDEMVDLLNVIKAERESVRTNRIEAVEAKKEAAHIASSLAEKVEEKAQEITDKVDKVPKKVVAILKEENV